MVDDRLETHKPDIIDPEVEAVPEQGLINILIRNSRTLCECCRPATRLSTRSPTAIRASQSTRDMDEANG
ncbi:unnamed protein product, partial [Brenthis ino]